VHSEKKNILKNAFQIRFYIVLLGCSVALCFKCFSPSILVSTEKFHQFIQLGRCQLHRLHPRLVSHQARIAQPLLQPFPVPFPAIFEGLRIPARQQPGKVRTDIPLTDGSALFRQSPVAGAALSAENILPSGAIHIKMNHIRLALLNDPPTLPPGQNRVHQRHNLLIGQTEIGHPQSRILNGGGNFSRIPFEIQAVQVSRQTVAAAAGDMATATGELLQQALSLTDNGIIFQGKAGEPSGYQSMVGDVPAQGGRIAAVADRAFSMGGVMGTMAVQALLTLLNAPGRQTV